MSIPDLPELLAILTTAVRCGDADDVESILSSYPAAATRSVINQVLRDGSTPLNVAIANGRFDVAHLLVDRGSDVNMPDSFRLDGCRRRPIHYACAVGCLELVKTFIEVLGVSVDEKDEGGSTPLHNAAAAGHIDIVEYLIAADCDLDAASNSGRTALWKAAQSGHREIVHLLLAVGARVDAVNRVGETILFECSRRLELVPILTDALEWGADVTAVDVEGNTALHVAAAAGNYMAAEKLVDVGVDVDTTNEYGNTALHNAVVHGQTPMMVFLLNCGADANMTNRSGQSPLYVGLLHQRSACVQLLLDSGSRLSSDETETFERLEAERHSGKRILFDTAQQVASRAALLANCCRTVIRRHLVNAHKPMIESVKRLPLPERLQMFLLLDEHTS